VCEHCGQRASNETFLMKHMWVHTENILLSENGLSLRVALSLLHLSSAERIYHGTPCTPRRVAPCELAHF
jgi:hypothetical protein